MYDRILNPIFGTFYANKPSYIPSFGHRMRLLQFLNIEILPKEDESAPWDDSNIMAIKGFNNQPKSITPDSVYSELFCYHKQQYSDYESVFTDGSKTGDHVGSAAIFNNWMVSEKLHKFCSVFTAEVYAIIVALQIIKSQVMIIYTDSKSSI
ncbi:hypothetical protein AVEN_274951-1 [Araneus ventricosus]|uniref:RNase H type-1 domain-containing protein n=1 Tax=Araneus ventricosus TaxID=182803 RepID=A0A4Y2QIT2_ARAVE|nr:hypothetical protein AVEN_274951-1 [Araneus ventricosus]